jgi:acyl transferase domain-containing protein
MPKPIVFMFSGQGSQYYHMGKELYQRHAGFKRWMDHCDEIAAPLIDASLIEVIFYAADKRQDFDRLLYSNPALLCFEYSLAQVLLDMDVKPDLLLGYSLGDITSSVLAGNMVLEEGIRFVVEMAKLFEAKSPPAKMLAILEPRTLMAQYPELFQNVWLTGHNFPKNFVVTGLPADIATLQQALAENKVIMQELPVRYGFHTPLLDPLADKVKQLAGGINFGAIDIPIISAVDGERKNAVDAEELWRITRQPVHFEQTLLAMLQSGDYTFVDVGPSGTLAAFVKYTMMPGSGSLALQTINRFGNDLESMKRFETALRE